MLCAPRFRWTASLSLVGLCLLSAVAAAETVKIEQNDAGAKITIDGQPFAEYLVKSGSKPIVWPIIGPTGKPISRAYPMADVAGEKRDHVHQRSLWFTHGDVDGVDFWSEPASYPKGIPNGRVLGQIVHRRFDKVGVEDGRAILVTTNDWIDQNGKKHCEDTRKLTFQVIGTSRVIDFDVTINATAGDVEFRDTKEGAMGIRVPTVMDVKGGNGHILTSEGMRDTEAWGKPARWVDYSGQVDGQSVGIAVLNHPSSFRHPTRWHVRDYGLFAANPFGEHEFDKTKEPRVTKIESGKSLTLRHRYVFHLGDAETANIAAEYERYSAAP
ncbi:MAG: PmoA family protein [Planctomycetes bacterium]|nr:PmoA family protein [Planctomycetota bacterium]